MIFIPGYSIVEEIKAGVKTIIYRAYSDRKQQPVIVKILKDDYPALEDIARFKHEYEMTKDLELSGIIKAYRLEKYQNRFALIFEDFGGRSLKEFTTSYQLNIKEFLKLAIQLAYILGELHQNQIIHKDIKPQNIIINPETREVKITDFSIASRLSVEDAAIANPHLLEGTLAYMSPEQTRRMNRAIDYRTDFYSLGITFYELLAGQLPFQASDPMEWIHCHIAKQPVPPDLIKPDIPPAVSDIVMKLLAKTAEERYQSAAGLRADLESCLTQLQNTGNIDRFPIGDADKSGLLQIPQKLYGRDREIAILIETFDRVSKGTTEMMLIAGSSGIGKSALVQEIHKPIARSRGYFISGKFDQYKRNIPYSSFVSAFQDLTHQLLAESQQQLENWKVKLLKALGSNGQVIVDMIPELELIIGNQPSVPLLSATESQNRFNLLFREFIHVFAQKEHPLVIFLDDLQWADLASLKLIQLLINDPDSNYLLLVGAYRNNEVEPTHPLMQTLEEIQKLSTSVNILVLGNLAIADVEQLIIDTLHCSPTQCQPIAELIGQKTNGNPFFLTQLLKSLTQQKLLTFNFSTGEWQWDINQLKTTNITDNVVELMVSKIEKLPTSAQNVLKIAACIGNRFDLKVIAIVTKKSLIDTAIQLWPALQERLIVPLSDTYKIPQLLDLHDGVETSSIDYLKVEYKFLHDRVQQAAYALIPENKKKSVHLKVGQLLLQNTSIEEQEEKIFDLVEHLNIGSELICSQKERYDLAKLNLMAGQKAKASTAYETAVSQLRMGLKLLAEDSWQSHYDLTLSLYVELVESEYLNANLERANELNDKVINYVNNTLEKIKLYEFQIQYFTSINKPELAIDMALKILNMLGVRLPKKPKEMSVRAALLLKELIEEAKQIETLADLPVMTDPHHLAAMRILMNAAAPAFVVNPALLQLIIFTMVKLSIQYGNSPPAAYSYTFYGVLLCGSYLNIDSGYQFGKLGLSVLEKFNARELKAKVGNMFNAFLRHWKEHASETIEPLREVIYNGIETGDLEYAYYGAVNYVSYMFYTGKNLNYVYQKQVQFFEKIKLVKLDLHLCWTWAIKEVTLKLLGKPGESLEVAGKQLNESEIIQQLIQNNNIFLLCIINCCKIINLYLFFRYEEAVDAARLGDKYEKGCTGMIYPKTHKLYYSLALLGNYTNVDDWEKKQYLKKVAENQKQMKLWAFHAPANFQHKYDLVEAERARVRGQVVKAMELYDDAIQGARKQGYIQEEALAYERAAEFYLNLGREEIAQHYMRKAHYGYLRWGATAKVKDLESRYPQLFIQIQEGMPGSSAVKDISDFTSTTTTTSTTTSSHSSSLDLASVVKASQAIAGEIVLDRLLDRLMTIVIENAGAQTACLIFKREGQWIIEATADLERDEVTIANRIPVENYPHIPLSVINYVARTQEHVVLNDASEEGRFTTDPYFKKTQAKSVLCTPIINQGQPIGLIYLENKIAKSAFTSEQIKVLRLLSSQIAISLQNALLYTDLSEASHNLKQANLQLEEANQTLEMRVRERTQELKEKNRRLRQTLQELKQTQTQLIQTEKMSSLGQMVAGVAHEINNPVNFIYGNVTHVQEYIKDLLHLLELYQHHNPQPAAEIEEEIQKIELEFLISDLPKMLSSMTMGAERIRSIVLSLRNFSRLDEAEKKPVNLQEGIDSTLLILQHRLKGTATNRGIEVIKEYSNLPTVECYAGQLNQVFMNVLSNAIDALEINGTWRTGHGAEKNLPLTYDPSPTIDAQTPTIRIFTEVINGNAVAIRISDNGPGMTEKVKKRLFDPFFTTKPVGKGTGLGLAISYQIVVEKHGGQLTCVSALGEGSEFIIEIPIQQQRNSREK